ncbi:exosortase Y [Pedobacter sandarakinus]|uniref:exosortase Y n=1 Tax=Pedobacter sandarakinus TaxID=353156 RepID=UPI002246D2B1|nr:archaeosortase/exosortase family protein [Pedobacter sandarakinus]MCX2575904.1 archaeosortase/exosortase family protein [Pedobacter sandarakinus]
MSEINTTPQKIADRKAITFVISMFVMYLIYSQGNLFMNSVMTPTGRFYNPFIANHFNYIAGLRLAIIAPSTMLIKAFGFYAIHNHQDILVVNGPYLRVSYSCLGLGVMSFLAAFTFAYPTSWRRSLKMLTIGIILVYILNICRIAGLGIIGGAFKSSRRYFEYHHEVFNVAVYIIIFTLLYFWVKRSTPNKQ